MIRILTIIALPLSILIALEYFTIFSINTYLPFDVTLLGALLLVAIQVISFIQLHTDSGGSTVMGKMIKAVLAIPGILYLLNFVIPINIGFDLEIIVAIFLFTEGLYALH